LGIADVLFIILGLLVMFTALSVVVLSLVWLERKLLGRLQRRLGPTRTGPMGLLQPIADAVKLVLKEDVVPAESERAIFWVAPLIVVISAFMVWVTIPASQNAVMKNLDLGLFYVTAFAIIGILGLVLAGWSSANKYGTLGGLRAAAQLISYEIPVIMVVVAVAMLAQSMDLRVIVDQQRSYPYALIQPLGLVIFFIAGLAEVGRTPFDIYFAESEIVGGPFVEYSGAHWSVFFLAEYINTFAIAALTVLLFLGGWANPFLANNEIVSIAWFLLKVYAVIMVVFWIRGTFPRLRIDQLMAFAFLLQRVILHSGGHALSRAISDTHHAPGTERLDHLIIPGQCRKTHEPGLHRRGSRGVLAGYRLAEPFQGRDEGYHHPFNAT